MRKVLLLLIAALLLNTPAIIEAQKTSNVQIEVLAGSDNIQLSRELKDSIRDAAKDILNKTLQNWKGYKGYASISLSCYVSEGGQKNIYRVKMVIRATTISKEAVSAYIIFDYNIENREYTIVKTGLSNGGTMANINREGNTSRIWIDVWSAFKISDENRRGVNDTLKHIIKERINLEDYSRIVAECYILKDNGGQYIIYVRILGKPASPENVKYSSWEAALKYNVENRSYNILSFYTVKESTVPKDISDRAFRISEKDERVKSFKAENAKYEISKSIQWINRREEIVKITYTATTKQNETYSLHRSIDVYVDVKGSEVLSTYEYKYLSSSHKITGGDTDTGSELDNYNPLQNLNIMLIVAAAAITATITIVATKIKR